MKKDKKTSGITLAAIGTGLLIAVVLSTVMGLAFTKKYLVSFDSNGAQTIEDSYYKKNSLVRKPTVSKTGYKLKDWRYNDKVWNFSTDKVTSNINLVANWNVVNYQITYLTNGGSMPTIDYIKEYNVLTDSSLPIPTYAFGVFSHWEDESHNVVNRINKGTTGDLTLCAVYSLNKYRVNVISTCADAATWEGDGYYTMNSTVTLKANINNGYKFNGWYKNSGFDWSPNTTWSFTMLYNDVDVELRAEAIKYNITYSNVTGVNPNPSVYTVESEFPLKPVEKDGYSFVTWLKDGEPYEYIRRGTTGDITLTPKYVRNGVNVTINYNEEECDVTGAGTYTLTESPVIKCIPKKHYVFDHWNKNGVYCSDQAEYMIDHIDTDYEFEAVCVPKEYQVIYYTDGEEVPDANPRTVNIKGMYYLYPPVIVHENRVFLHWEIGNHVRIENITGQLIWNYIVDNDYLAFTAIYE